MNIKLGALWGLRWSNGGRPGGSFSVATVGKSSLAKLRAGRSQGVVASEVFVNVWASLLEERRWPGDRTWKKKSKQSNLDSPTFAVEVSNSFNTGRAKSVVRNAIQN